MSFTWRYERSSGELVRSPELPPDAFPTQADAESWVGEKWRELVAAGVDQVTLLENGAEVYGPMSLHPAS
jgi:hypothetical protein